MRKGLLPILLFAASGSAFATVRTVSNAPANPGQYSSYTAAEAASASGDTIYIHGSSLNYNSIVVTKTVVIIGTGHKPQKQAPLVSKFEYIGLNTAASGTKLIGLECDYIYTNNGNVQNILISRCRINNYFYLNGWSNQDNFTFESVVFAGINQNIRLEGLTVHDFFFYNCVYNGHLDNNNGTSYNMYMQNCVFLGVIGNNQILSYAWRNTQYSNCIFYGRDIRDSYYGVVSDCTFLNCISYQSPNNSIFPAGTGNLPNTDPQFVSYPGNVAFDYTHNYQLQSTSPGHNAGTDSKDIGLYGGAAIYNQYGIPRIPQMLQFNLANSTVPANGTLQVTIQAAVQQ